MTGLLRTLLPVFLIGLAGLAAPGHAQLPSCGTPETYPCPPPRPRGPRPSTQDWEQYRRSVEEWRISVERKRADREWTAESSREYRSLIDRYHDSINYYFDREESPRANRIDARPENRGEARRQVEHERGPE